MARSKGPGETAAPLIPPHPTLTALRRAAAGCQACPLYQRGTQTVFGEGSRGARLVLVGEQPSNYEDLEGRPFVGPAGRLLDRCLQETSIDRGDTYVTNVVKHFKWEPQGKRRIHARPNAKEIAACRPWLEAELKVVQPTGLVCLGATAAQALLGRDFRVTQSRGRLLPSPLAPLVLATVHPSSILRIPEGGDRRAEIQRLVEDLRVIAEALASAEQPMT